MTAHALGHSFALARELDSLHVQELRYQEKLGTRLWPQAEIPRRYRAQPPRANRTAMQAQRRTWQLCGLRARGGAASEHETAQPFALKDHFVQPQLQSCA